MDQPRPNLREASRLLGVYTAGRYDVWILAGSARASCRAHILSELTGTRVPQSKAGVNALRAAFYTAYAITGQHEAEREDRFLAAVRNWSAPFVLTEGL